MVQNQPSGKRVSIVITRYKLIGVMFAIFITLGGLFFYLFVIERFYRVFPDVAHYQNNILFTYNQVDVVVPTFWLSRTRDTYTRCRWKASNGPQEVFEGCSIAIDGVVWDSKKLEYEQFLKEGAEDQRYVVARELSLPPDTNALPQATYHTAESDVFIHCIYDRRKKLCDVEVGFVNHPRLRKKSTLLKKLEIELPAGKVRLPCDHATLTKSLGAPIKHFPAHVRRLDHQL